MVRAAHMLVALTFTVGCLGLWAVLTAMHSVIRHTLTGLWLPGLTEFCFDSRTWLPFIPLPVIGYSLLRLRGSGPTLEHLAVFASVLALTFTTAFFTVAVAMLLPWMKIVTPI